MDESDILNSREQIFFDAMDKIMEGTTPEDEEKNLDEIEKKYFLDYREERLSKLLLCPRCERNSKREDFQPERHESYDDVLDRGIDRVITFKDVTIIHKCPKCGTRFYEAMAEPVTFKKDYKTVFCIECKKERRLRDCRKIVSKHNFYDGYTYYDSIEYDCPSCRSCVKIISTNMERVK